MFKTGESGNPSGKPKGAKNKIAETMRGRINTFLSDNYDTFISSFNALSDDDKVKTYISMLKYAVPTLSSASVAFDYNKLNEAQCDYILDKFRNGESPTLDELNEIGNV